MTEIYISELERPLISVAIDGSKYYVVTTNYVEYSTKCCGTEVELHTFETLSEAERYVQYEVGEIDYDTYYAPNTAVVDYVGHIHRPPFCRKCGANLIKQVLAPAGTGFGALVVCCPVCTATTIAPVEYKPLRNYSIK